MMRDDDHASTSSLIFYRLHALPDARPTEALKTYRFTMKLYTKQLLNLLKLC